MLNTPKKMNKGSTANNDTGCPAKSTCRYGHMTENHVTRATQLSVREEKQGPVTTNKQEVRRQSGRTTSTSGLTSCSHQRRWSSDCCHSNSSPVIIVKKNVGEPQPPQRGASLLRCHPPSPCPRQRYSSPITGIDSTTHLSTSSSSSCSSPVRTSVITGHDPLGWKLRPKSSTSSNRAHTNRLSLQMPIPVTIPDPNFLLSNTSATSPLDPIRKTKTHFEFKPSRRHHSDSSAFLGSMPVVTLEELRDVHLRSAVRSDERDDVFCEEKATPQPHKKPPAVPEKSPLARKIAQLIAHSWQHQMRAARKIEQEEIIYSVMKPKSKRQ
ncbi:uncharacterized protein LOC133418029 [Phycodurus eques]|uniref:uncharacterized protein LOC133418029 n=1 Tax=Phycodurus eques TaxID=693459 RepID=UPI002ACDF5AC|nr:uncharacterized protein LOC133418029 [Phycodurus eques]